VLTAFKKKTGTMVQYGEAGVSRLPLQKNANFVVVGQPSASRLHIDGANPNSTWISAGSTFFQGKTYDGEEAEQIVADLSILLLTIKLWRVCLLLLRLRNKWRSSVARRK